jgi:hypothetical protein
LQWGKKSRAGRRGFTGAAYFLYPGALHPFDMPLHISCYRYFAALPLLIWF